MKSPLFLKNPAALTLAAGVVLAGAGVALSRNGGSALTSTVPTPYQPSPSVSIGAERIETLPDLKSLDMAFQRLAEYASPAVVQIKTEAKPSYSLLGERQVVAGEGSGVVFRPDGWIVTNAHVVDGFDKVTVVLHDGREFPGTVKSAPESDIAVVKIDASGLKTLPFANSANVHVGQLAMAVGAPFGLENTVTYGHVSATGRTNVIPDPRTGSSRQYFDLIQTDAPINMGNSGGPLIDADGEVVGINTAIFSTTGYSSGIGFAISANQARLLAETLIEKGKVQRSYMGVLPETLKEYEQKKLNLTGGAILRNVPNDGPAAMAGLHEGDVVVKFGTLTINTEADLRNAMFRYQPGTAVPVEIVRDGHHQTFQVKLTEPPAQQQPLQRSAPRDGFQIPDTPGMPDLPGMGDGRPHLPKDDGSENAPQAGRARLGVQVQNLTDEIRTGDHIPANERGAYVATVEPDSAADRLGLKAGDIIESLGGKTIKSSEDLVTAMQSLKWGDPVSITFARFSNGAAQRITKQGSLK